MGTRHSSLRRKLYTSSATLVVGASSGSDPKGRPNPDLGTVWSLVVGRWSRSGARRETMAVDQQGAPIFRKRSVRRAGEAKGPVGLAEETWATSRCDASPLFPCGAGPRRRGDTGWWWSKIRAPSCPGLGANRFPCQPYEIQRCA